MVESPCPEVHFGGPDLPPRALRNLLEERVHAVPAGGTVDWVTYYFRDRALASALLEAHRRGVMVRVTLDGCPRTAHASDRVTAMLSGAGGLGRGLRTVRMLPLVTPPGKPRRPHLHEKLYCFSHPEPLALVGSFNPSGDDPEEDPAVIEEIRDQDRGHNLLVGFRAPLLVAGLLRHARWIHRTRFPGLLGGLHRANRSLVEGPSRVIFLPRPGPHPVVRLLRRLGPGARIAIAGSHIKGGGVERALVALARRGALVDVIAEHTLRRVPAAIEDTLRAAGIAFRRLVDPHGLPMHNKFVLAEEGSERWVIFGSFNWTTRSFWLNREICVISRDPTLFDAFHDRWLALKRL